MGVSDPAGSDRHTAFSVESDSITLWSEFGNNTGYNLEFRSGELLDMISRTKKI